MGLFTQVKSKFKSYEGKDIREVWDWRLSQGNPILYCDGPTWIIKIWSNSGKGLLQKLDTNVPTKGGLANYTDYEAVAKCYKKLYAVRDRWSRKNVDKLKPVVAEINRKNGVKAGLGPKQ